MFLAVSVVLAWASSATAQTAAEAVPQPNPTGISAQVTKQDKTNVVDLVRRAVANHNLREAEVASYTYFERELDSYSQANHSDTYEIMVIAGAPYRRHVAHNDQPLPLNEQEDEEAKIKQARNQRAVQETLRQMPPFTSAAVWHEKARLRVPLQLLPDRFEIKLTGEELVDGRKSYVLEATPLTHLKATTEDEHNAQDLKLKLWIDAADMQISKVEALVIRKGFANEVERIWSSGAPDAETSQDFQQTLRKLDASWHLIYERGTVITEEWKKINSEVWLPSSFSVRGKAHAVGALGATRSVPCDRETTYYGYEKFRVDTQILPQ